MTLKLHYYDRVSSTMDVMHEIAGRGAAAGTAVLAGEQLQGRGSRGRSWHSPPGGLWLSVLFRPPVAQGVEVISLRAGLAVAEALQPLIPQSVQLKWPNDIMLYGRKLGGVLCEARWQGESLGWVVVGVGLNIKNSVPHELEGGAVSLAASGIDPDLSEASKRIVAALRELDLNASELSPSELSRFAARDCLRGRAIREPISGVVQGVSADGALMVQPNTGSLVAIRTGPVTSAESLTAGTFDHVAHTRHR